MAVSCRKIMSKLPLLGALNMSVKSADFLDSHSCYESSLHTEAGSLNTGTTPLETDKLVVNLKSNCVLYGCELGYLLRWVVDYYSAMTRQCQCPSCRNNCEAYGA